MNRFFWCLFLSFATISNVAAQESNRYVRKQLRPAFFVPEKEFNKAEKLPQVLVKKVYIKAPEKKVQTQQTFSSPQDMVYTTDETVIETVEYTPPVAPQLDTNKILPQNPNDIFENKLSDTKEYKEIQKQYKSDMIEISKTHKLPNNPTLRKNLLKMDSNDEVRVNDSFAK